MLFFFDESGDFSLPNADEHKCAVICGVVIPETVADKLQQNFEVFVSSLSKAEKVNGEPKGMLLTDKNRARFCEILSGYNKVLVTPTTLDLSISSRKKTPDICDEMKANLFESAKKCTHNTMRSQIEEMGRQWGNLSINEGLRLVALTSCFWEAIEHSVIFHSGKDYHECWNNLHFVIDAVKTAKLSREEKVFTWMVLMWLTAWTKHRPLILIEEIHTPDHPFVKKYNAKKGFRLGKMLKGNIRYCNSKESWGLQIADICANIVYQAVHDLKNYNNRLPIFRMLMKNCPYGPERGGPGLICVGELTTNRKKPSPQYRLLYQVMHSDK
jgi:hypothetical protein